MSTIGWIILLVLVLPIIGLLGWLFLAASFVRVPSGSQGLVMIKGQATDKTLPPGAHFVPALRRHMIEEYPSVELAYRAGGPDDTGKPELNQSGPPLQVTLGDRTTAVLSVTVRFRLIPERLRLVHERFGPKGFFGIVRDESSRAVITTLGATETGIDNLFGADREKCEERLRAAADSALAADGIELTSLLLGPVDLGRTGEVIAATVRARYELEREQAEAATRMARALNDADLQQHMTSSSDGAWRYRETDLWRDLVQRTNDLQVALRAGPGQAPVGVTVDQPLTDDQSGSVTPQ
jgi:regulator of protease activity HflC (stomatin/prohibitin superfamily)